MTAAAIAGNGWLHPMQSARPSWSRPMVSDDTAEKLRRAAGKIGTWTDKRDALIAQARQEGGTLREIADMAGLTHPGVAKILERNEPERHEES